MMYGFDMPEQTAFNILRGKSAEPYTKEQLDTAYRMAICALRKRIPTAPDVVVRDGEEPYISKCPWCGENIEETNFCPYCGGAVDFEKARRRLRGKLK